MEVVLESLPPARIHCGPSRIATQALLLLLPPEATTVASKVWKVPSESSVLICLHARPAPPSVPARVSAMFVHHCVCVRVL